MPITKFGYGRNSEEKVTTWQDIKGGRVIDVGGGKEKHLPDKFQHIAAIADILPPGENIGRDVVWFSGDLNLPEIWSRIMENVEAEGQFEFAICTHTLEDLRNPLLTATMLPKVAKAGLVTFPSVHAEARRFELLGSYRGWRHHRWIHKVVVPDGTSPRILAIPKLALFEKREFSRLESWDDSVEELWVHWETDLPYELFKNDHLGPNEWDFYEDYSEELLGQAGRTSALAKWASSARSLLKKKIQSSRRSASKLSNQPASS